MTLSNDHSTYYGLDAVTIRPAQGANPPFARSGMMPHMLRYVEAERLLIKKEE